ncbi:hypothetical protein, partial [Pseudomonas sp. NPDC087614]
MLLALAHHGRVTEHGVRCDG